MSATVKLKLLIISLENSLHISIFYLFVTNKVTNIVTYVATTFKHMLASGSNFWYVV